MTDPLKTDLSAAEAAAKASALGAVNAAESSVVTAIKNHLLISHSVAAGVGAALLKLAQHFL
jgi:hypothetical protein